MRHGLQVHDKTEGMQTAERTGMRVPLLRGEPLQQSPLQSRAQYSCTREGDCGAGSLSLAQLFLNAWSV